MRFAAQTFSFRKIATSNFVLLGCFFVYGVYFFSTLSSVPFHPDESTQLYTSADIEDFFADPLSLSFKTGNSINQRVVYRVLDSPLTRYLIGIGRLITRHKPLPVDWDWSKTWQENVSAGAFPSDSMLLMARFSVAVFIPISLILFYLMVQQIDGKLTALLGTIFLALNGLFLLHTRRAMAESILIFAITCSLWYRFHPFSRNKVWTIAIPIALAINAKQSAVSLFLAGLITLVFFQPEATHKKRVLSCILFLGVIMIITLLLNPFLWAEPLTSLRYAIEARQNLLSRQVQEIRNVRPDLVFDTVSERLAGMIAHAFFTPPAIADIGNYLEDTLAVENTYFSSPLTKLGRGLAGGTISFFLSTFGFAVGSHNLLKSYRQTKGGNTPDTWLKLGWIWVATLSQALVNLIFFPLPFQRYVMPLIPYVCFWSAYGLAIIIKIFLKKTSSPLPV